MAIAIKNNMMKKRAQEAVEVFFKHLFEELKRAINAKKGGGKQKKKIQKGGVNNTRPVAQILEEMASYIKKYPNTISVLEGMVEKYDPNVKNAIKGNTELMKKLDLE